MSDHECSENQFSGFGRIVSGKSFIGRREDLEVIRNRVISPREPGNLAIIGEHRIGKSSLIHKAFVEPSSELASKGLIAVSLSLGVYKDVDSFFSSMVTGCAERLKEIGRFTKDLAGLMKVVDRCGDWGSVKFVAIQRFFKEVMKERRRVILVLDEFDHSRKLFEGDPSNFQKLRELCYNPEGGVSIVTASRRTIRDIEQQSGFISNFDGILQKHFLGMFVDHDVDEFYGRLSSLGISVPVSDRAIIDYHAGKHPYLLHMIGCEMVEMHRRGEYPGIEALMERVQQPIMDYFDHLLDTLKEEGNLTPLVETVFETPTDVDRNRVERLRSYGMIRAVGGARYISFCGHFDAYLAVQPVSVAGGQSFPERNAQRGFSALHEEEIPIRIRDRKESNLVEVKETIDVRNPEPLAEFVRDIIAMANTSLRRRSQGFILVAPYDPSKAWSCPFADDAIYQQIISSHIEPEVTFLFEPKSIEGQDYGVFTVEPIGVEPFRVKKRVSDQTKVHIDAGHSWIRHGTSKDFLRTDGIIELTRELASNQGIRRATSTTEL